MYEYKIGKGKTIFYPLPNVNGAMKDNKKEGCGFELDAKKMGQDW